MEHTIIPANVPLCCICPGTILVANSLLQGALFSLLNLAVLRDMTHNSVGQWPDLVWQSLYSDTTKTVNFLILQSSAKLIHLGLNNRSFFVKY